MNSIKRSLNNERAVEIQNNENDIQIFLGYQDRHCLMLNSKVIKSTKTWKPIKEKLIILGINN